jgi:hypothetical protein
MIFFNIFCHKNNTFRSRIYQHTLLKKLLLKNTSKFDSTKRFFTATTIATVKTNNITYELIDAYLFFRLGYSN